MRHYGRRSERDIGHKEAMADSEKDRFKGSIKGDAARADRLAAELRRNLRRRKDRARAVTAADAARETGGAGEGSVED